MYTNNGDHDDKYLDREIRQKNREVPPKIEYVADYTPKMEVINQNTEALRREKNQTTKYKVDYGYLSNSGDKMKEKIV